MDGKTIHMIRNAIHITRKPNRAATDMNHGLIRTDHDRNPYGLRDSEFKIGVCG
jgi:hypothetical protein